MKKPDAITRIKNKEIDYFGTAKERKLPSNINFDPEEIGEFNKPIRSPTKPLPVKPIIISPKIPQRKTGRIVGWFGNNEGKNPLSRAQEAYKEFIKVTLNGVEFTIAPTRIAMTMKMYARSKPGNSRSQYDSENWITLNDKFVLFTGFGINKDDLCKGAGMKVFDVAVPEPWLKQPENLKKWKSGEWCVWSYDGKDRIFGKPVWRTEIMRNLKRNILSALRR